MRLNEPRDSLQGNRQLDGFCRGHSISHSLHLSHRSQARKDTCDPCPELSAAAVNRPDEDTCTSRNPSATAWDIETQSETASIPGGGPPISFFQSSPEKGKWNQKWKGVGILDIWHEEIYVEHPRGCKTLCLPGAVLANMSYTSTE